MSGWSWPRRTRSPTPSTAPRLDAEAEDITAQASSEYDADEDELANVKEVVEDAPIVKLVNLLITQAVSDRASDIHIEPTEHDVRVRYRIDGVLHEMMRPPKNIQSGIISRLKIMADINIAERRIPQDGRVIGGDRRQGQVDLRVATLPTVYGEKVVMRILDKSTAVLRLVDLGFLPSRPASASSSRTASRTARSWSRARPARASRPRSTPP